MTDSAWTLVCVGIGPTLYAELRGFFRKDTSSYDDCYSCRLAYVRCHARVLKIPHVTYN